MEDSSQPILVDSAIYISYLRAEKDIRQTLMPYLVGGLLFSCGVVRCEVLRGFKNERIMGEMSDFFDIMPEVPTTAKIWQQAADLAWRLDRTVGGLCPLTDIVIACSAMKVGAMLVSPDQHFQDIPNLKRRAAL
jgi:predicted nucleic acid-binding protein